MTSDFVFVTVQQIAARCTCPVHRVEYVLRTRGIPASARAGNTRLFSPEAVDRITQELRDLATAEHLRHRGHGQGLLPSAAAVQARDPPPI